MPDSFRVLLAAVVLIAEAAIAAVDPAPAEARPNILLIVADDLGFADLGVHGSDITTPRIDRLAAEGALFTAFHTAPMCAPSRAMLLTGNNSHVAGMARQDSPGLGGAPFPGYENGLSGQVAALPALLRDAGYNTYTVGKWHLGFDRDQSPAAAGFSRSWNMLDGAGTHYDGVGFQGREPRYWADDDYAEYPVGEYSTRWYTDRLIEFIEGEKDSGKPFFAYAAYTSPHWPLQVPDAYLNAYSGRYDDGYEALRERNFAALRDAGIVAPGSTLPPPDPAVQPWASLGEKERRRESRKMELYAAMVDNLDDHIGRLLDFLAANDLDENTLVVFMSDNGAAGVDFYNEGPFVDYVRERFDNDYALMGTSRSFVSYGKAWAEAGSAPFSRRKRFSREGGIRAPFIIAGPGVEGGGRIVTSYMTIMDLAPTFLEVAGAAYPDDGSVQPMLGESLVPVLTGAADTVHAGGYVTALYHAGVAMLRRGPWKLTNLEAPFDEADFALFNVIEDPGETLDLRDREPALYDELVGLWQQERRRLGILLPEDL